MSKDKKLVKGIVSYFTDHNIVGSNTSKTIESGRGEEVIYA